MRLPRKPIFAVGETNSFISQLTPVAHLSLSYRDNENCHPLLRSTIRRMIHDFNYDYVIERILLLNYAGLSETSAELVLDVFNQIHVNGQSWPVENLHCILQLD